MTAATETAQAPQAQQQANPLAELQRNWSTYSSMFQALVGVYQGFPIADDVKLHTLISMNKDFAFTQNAIQQIANNLSQVKIVGVQDAPQAPAPAAPAEPAEKVEAAPAA